MLLNIRFKTSDLSHDKLTYQCTKTQPFTIDFEREVPL